MNNLFFALIFTFFLISCSSISNQGVRNPSNSSSQFQLNELLVLPKGHNVKSLVTINGDDELVISHNTTWDHHETNMIYYKNGKTLPLLDCEANHSCSSAVLDFKDGKLIISISQDKGKTHRYGILDLETRSITQFNPAKLQPDYRFLKGSDQPNIDLSSFHFLSENLIVFAGNQHGTGFKKGLYSVQVGIDNSVKLLMPEITYLSPGPTQNPSEHKLIERDNDGKLIVQVKNEKCTLRESKQTVERLCNPMGPQLHRWPPNDFEEIERIARIDGDGVDYITSVDDSIIYLQKGTGRRSLTFLQVAPKHAPRDFLKITSSDRITVLKITPTHLFFQSTDENNSDTPKESVTKLYSLMLK